MQGSSKNKRGKVSTLVQYVRSYTKRGKNKRLLTCISFSCRVQCLVRVYMIKPTL